MGIKARKSQGLEEAYESLALREADSLASMEGVPEWDLGQPSGKDPEEGFGLLTGWLNRISKLLPGLVLTVFLMFCAKGAANLLGATVFQGSLNPVSPVLIIIILGIVFRNICGVPESYVEGLRFSIKRVLRIGIVLLGLRLSLTETGQLGLRGIPVVVLCIGSALVFGLVLTHFLNLSKRLGMLIAVGTSICGVSAVVATAPAINAEEDEVSYSVACVTLFGLCGLIFYPYLAHWIFGVDSGLVGMFLGTAIHDTSQVVGAGLTYTQIYGDETVLEVATVTKLVRNLFMILVIPLAVALCVQPTAERGKAKGLNLRGMVPLFVLLFAGMAMIRSLGDLGDRPFGFLNPEGWETFLGLATDVSGICFLLAMASLGLSTSLVKLRALGLKPMLIGFVTSTGVGLLSVGTLLFFYR